RTGLAFTDDVHIHEYAARWGMVIKRPTKGGVVAEKTAAVIWSVLSQIEVSVFLWNVFPLHPHKPGNSFSNRSHNSLERRTGEEFLSQLILLLKPHRLVAIGNDAARTAQRLRYRHRVFQVRHPSYGGQTQFLAQMCKLYNLQSDLFQTSH
ncbi:MAG: uracil-DNA glycosylase, partial [Gemmatimonadetes bacterium]|nr:uracil-DNA glycosylase [Gemmatimonadota bacterium]